MFSIIRTLTTITLISLVMEANTSCTKNFNKDKCQYDMLCEDMVTTISWDELSYHPGIYVYNNNFNSNNCENSNVLYVNGMNVHGIDLVYKSSIKNITIVPTLMTDNIYNGVGSKILKLILSLDLSNNEFNAMPNFKSMDNLKEINLSNNVLVTTKLSNPFYLKSLVSIDLSNNNLNQLTVDGTEHVYAQLARLNLSHNYFVSIPDTIFDGINNLQILDLSNNYIESLTPVTFEGIKRLTNLNLSHNRITDLNSSLFRFTELVVLDLSHNRITQIKGNELEKLRSVTEVKLDHNSISVIEKNTFNNLEHLTTLILNNNKLLSLDKDTFLHNIALESIDLSHNLFTMLPKNIFKNNYNIVYFSIYGNVLEGTLTRGTFEGLKRVNEIDLRNHNITTIEDYAFLGLDNVTTIFLNHNKIQSLSKKSFSNLNMLKILDLSDNCIGSIDFEKKDLINLESLLIKNNNISKISHDQFSGLNRLKYLDISNNNISQLESNSFQSLENLITFQISKNPLGEVIFENTFEGLNSLPTLDISHTSIVSIHNNTFKGMIGLNDLNISNSKLKELQFNCFLFIDSVERIDISNNFLTSFEINTTSLLNLHTLLLNNNLIKTVLSNSFVGLRSITEINLAYNNLEVVEVDAFRYQDDLRILDLSHNIKFKFHSDLIKSAKYLQKLILSATDSDLTFSNINDVEILSVELSQLKLTNISKVHVNKLRRLSNVILKQNEITALKIGDFTNMTELKDIDLSYNKITFIQPGTFKELSKLEHLNISHNSLADITYGIFRGLNYLNILDISYNFINSLEGERFFELLSLNTLIADHNLITNIAIDDFSGNSLTLSIGDNPLPCEDLVKFHKNPSRVTITAITLLDNKSENVYGISCNLGSGNRKVTPNIIDRNYGNNVLNEIKDILLNMSSPNKSNNNKESSSANEVKINLTPFISDISNSFNYSATSLTNNINGTAEKVIVQIRDNSLQQSKINNETNIILNRILNILSESNSLALATKTSIPLTKENATFDFIPYLNRIKYLENTISANKQDLVANLTNLAAKLSHLESQIQTIDSNGPKHEKLISSNKSDRNLSNSYFTEICVSMILVILIGFILFKIYKSKFFIRKRRSMSTSQLPDAMESSNL